MKVTLKPMMNGQSVSKFNEDCVTLSRHFVARISSDNTHPTAHYHLNIINRFFAGGWRIGALENKQIL